MKKKSEIQVAALSVRQGKHVLYSFAVDGRDLESFTTVSRACRDDQYVVQGYQRQEVIQHVLEISQYLQTQNAMLPNPLVVAFDKDSLSFKPVQKFGMATFGVLTIPTTEDWRARCGFVVDGQQRRAAIRDSALTGFPVLISGFVSETEEERRDQFILVNSTKPLPRALIFELLPGTQAPLPPRFAKHKESVLLLERLNNDKDSCLRRLIHTPTMPHGIIKDNSLLKGINSSISDGVLYDLIRSPESRKSPDLDGAAAILKRFWLAVSKVFPNDWARPPRQSRLLHGAGVVGLSFLMDGISHNRYRVLPEPPSVEEFVANLELMKPWCAWSSGQWWFGRDYRDIQNTPKDVSMFVHHLCSKYMDLLKEWHDERTRPLENPEPVASLA